MGLGDTLEKLFSVETETTIESAMMEFVRAGDNFKSKTNLPFHKASLAVSFLEKLGEDMDDEFSEVIQYVNHAEGIPMYKKGKPNPEVEKPSKFINEVLIEGMILEPSINAKARDELLQALKFRQDIEVRKSNDTISKVQEWLNR